MDYQPGEFHASTSRIRTFDPARAGDVPSSLAAGRIYEGLYQYDYLARPYRLIPLLAADMPEVSPDGLTLTIRLRPGIRFQDDPCFAETNGRGRPLTARDAVYSLLRIADLKVGSSGFWAFRNKIAGLDAFREKSGAPEPTDYDTPVEGLRALDDLTLQIKLLQPYPQLIWVLAMTYGYIVPREAVEFYGDQFSAHPVGSGPFLLQSARHNYRYEYARNPNWTPRHPNDPLPQLQRLVYYVMEDASVRWLAFLSGQLDLYSDIANDNWDVVFTSGRKLSETLAARGIRLHAIAGLNVYYIGFNMDDPILGPNKKLRQALTCAFNSDEWTSYYQGRVTRATGPIPPGVAGSSGTNSPYPFNLEKARALLAEAGYPDGLDPKTGKPLTLTLELGKTDSEMRESSELIVHFMNQIGVTIVPSYNNRPAFFEKIEKRNAQMFRLSWFADYPDGQNFLQLFYSPNASPGPNRVNYHNEEFDRLYEQAAVLMDGPERTRLYRQMANLVIEDCPWIFTHHPVDYSLSHQRLQNYQPHDFPYGMEKYLTTE